MKKNIPRPYHSYYTLPLYIVTSLANVHHSNAVVRDGMTRITTLFSNCTASHGACYWGREADRTFDNIAKQSNFWCQRKLGQYLASHCHGDGRWGREHKAADATDKLTCFFFSWRQRGRGKTKNESFVEEIDTPLGTIKARIYIKYNGWGNNR